jgi:signal transduction histidine kinase/ligand-binding sensor domain-containing protein
MRGGLQPLTRSGIIHISHFLTLLRFSRTIPLEKKTFYLFFHDHLQERLIRISRIPIFFLVIPFAIASVFTTLISQYKIDVWTTAEGLPQNSVNAILQTRDGYMWLGTYGGLVRFDGISFTPISGSEGLPSNRILALCESRDSSLWIGTEGGGLSHYTNGALVHYGKEEGLMDDVVYTLCEDRDTILWIGTRTGVQCLRHGKIQSHPFGGQILSASVRSIRYTHTGVLWINSDREVYRIIHGNLDIVLKTDPKTQRVPAFLFEDFDTSVWMRGIHGLLHYIDGRIESVTQAQGLSSYYVTAMVRDSNDTYWAGTLNGGVCNGYLKPSKKFTNLQFPDGKKNAKIQTCFIDREGNRWIGTDGDGLVRFKDRMIDIIGPKDGLTHQIIEAVFEDSQRTIWVGTNDGGLYHSSKGNTSRFTEKKGFPNESIWSIAEDSQGALWAGSYGGGLYRYQNGKIKNFGTEQGLVDNVILALYCDRDGALWIGTDNGGVNIYRDGKFRSLTEKDGLSNLCVRTFLEDRSGAMWIGTRGGLNRYQNGKIKVLTTQNGLSYNVIRSIYEDADSVLWIGTYGGGLNRLKKDTFTNYTTLEGLYDNVVSAILEDDQNNLWMSCNRGIFRVSRKQLNEFAEGRIPQITCIAYGTEHGLISDETNGGFQPAAWRTKDGKLLFPTIKGLAVIPLARVKANTNIPRVHIEKVLVNQAEYALSSQIEIPYDRQQIEIHYSALNFTDPQYTIFKFWLEGVNVNWIEAKKRRIAYFPNLPSGEYKFHVIAANSDGVWNYEGASIDIVITPPFWETWYFRASAVIILLMIGYAFYYQRNRQKMRRLLEQQQYTHQLLDSMELERKRIASELHDSIGQELLIIKNRASLALRDMKSKRIIKEQLDEISNTATQAIQETREISYNLRPYQIDRLGLTKAIESIINRAAQTAAIVFTTDIDIIDNLIPKGMEIHFYRIIQECMNNILKHSKATTCKIIVKRWHDRLNIDIEDNGIGFNTSEESMQDMQGFGLHGITERVQLLGGKVSIESTPSHGTRVLLTLKINEETNTSN